MNANMKRCLPAMVGAFMMVLMALPADAVNGSIEGTVSDNLQYPAYGIVIANATISVQDNANNMYTAKADAYGHYNVTVPEGSYTLTVYATDYITKTVSVTVNANESLTKNICLDIDSGNITGTITDQDTGKPIYGAIVKRPEIGSILPGDFNGYWGKTDSNGKYSITGVFCGNVNFTVQDFGYAGVDFTIPIHAGKTATKDIELQPVGYVKIFVKDKSSGQFLSNATVKLGDACTGTTDSSGTVTLWAHAGKCTLEVSAPGYNTKNQTITVINDGTIWPYEAALVKPGAGSSGGNNSSKGFVDGAPSLVMLLAAIGVVAAIRVKSKIIQ